MKAKRIRGLRLINLWAGKDVHEKLGELSRQSGKSRCEVIRSLILMAGTATPAPEVKDDCSR
jgi:hypothetical protein